MKSGNWPGSMNEVFPPISAGSFDIECLAICLRRMGIENTVMLEKIVLSGELSNLGFERTPLLAFISQQSLNKRNTSETSNASSSFCVSFNRES